ncbi:MAG: CPBP family intramembrane metalloprotease [Gammaproteobacteria bacterium]|nr:CPBP family intramembrane metalloprotease [Gammaproteobacteria bacterium]
MLIARRHGMAFVAGLRLGSLRRFRIARIFGAGMALQVVGVLLAALMPPPEELASPMMRFLSFGRWAVLLLFVLAVVLAPLLEESLFRGVLLPALRKHMAFQPAALLVTVLFAALHGVQTGGYVPALVVIALAGYVMAYLREASGALWPPILFHMGFNFTALLPVVLLGERVPEGYPGEGPAVHGRARAP